ncbi:MAG: hypothetical protein MRY83_20315 [Flavobacteriales bacterium]|nr:hypothetical protein [Flavobacteriales bacterium]
MMIEVWNICIIIFAVIGVLVTILKFFSLSTRAIVWWQNFIEKVAKNRRNKFLKKKATQFKIEAIVNATVFDLQKELPKNWVKKMHIKWVDQGSIKKLDRGQKIIRIEPEDRQDYNLINGIFSYYQNCLFPNTFEVVPDRVFNALVVKLSQRTIQNSARKDFLLKIFNSTILEREIQNDIDVLKFFEPFVDLDERGFLTGALVREIDAIAEKIRVKQIRGQFESIILNTVEHMRLFTGKLKGGKGAIAEDEWEFSNDIHTYRFLLAKRQSHMKIDAHFKRAVNAFDDNVDRLYIFGSNRDIPFTTKLIARISNKTGYKHIETFDLDRDFHSNKKGIGAIFIKQ